MKRCHTCGYYSQGWCSVHNRSQSPGGQCSSWSGRSPRKEKPGPPKGLPGPDVMCCYNCAWRDKAVCTNISSSYYDMVVQTRSLCSFFEGEERLSKILNKATNKKPKRKEKGEKYTRDNPKCRTCAWWEQGVCTNPDSQAFDRVMLSGSVCTVYQHEKGDPYRYFPQTLIDSAKKRHKANSTEKIESKQIKQKKHRNKYTNNNAKMTQINIEEISVIDSRKEQHRPTLKLNIDRKRLEGERCNRCMHYISNTCKCEKSPMYKRNMRPLEWCEHFDRYKF